MSDGFTCPGLDVIGHDEVVACYRAGHVCPPVAVVVSADASGGRKTRWFCPCCGQGSGAMFVTADMLADAGPYFDERMLETVREMHDD